MYIILFHFTDCFVMFMKGFVCVSEWVETLWYGGTNCHVTVTTTTYWRTCLLTTEKMWPFFTHGFSWDWSLRPILKGCQIGYTWCVYEGKTTREIFCSKSLFERYKSEIQTESLMSVLSVQLLICTIRASTLRLLLLFSIEKEFCVYTHRFCGSG